MAARSKESSLRDHQNDVLPKTSPTPLRTNNTILAGELSEKADEIEWPGTPEMEEIEATAQNMLASGYNSTNELVETSSYGRAQLREMSLGEKPSWVRSGRKMWGARAPPVDSGPKKSAAQKEIDIHAATKAYKALPDIGDILKPRQESVDLFREPLREGSRAQPP